MINRILERLEALKGKDICFGMNCEECYKKFGIGVDCDEATQKLMIDQCKAIVQEVAKDGGWIPCSERLPKEYVSVLVCDRAGDIYVALMYDTKIYGKVWRQWNGGELRLDWVIAWQPLPAPYQKGE